MKITENKGMTLISIIISIAILTVLTTVGVMPIAINKYKIQIGERVGADTIHIQTACYNYYKENGNVWPSNVQELKTNGYLPDHWPMTNPEGNLYTLTSDANKLTVSTNINEMSVKVANKIVPLPGTSPTMMQSTIINSITNSLNSYDSGWFAVAPARTYPIIHNLGTTNFIVQIFWSASADGSNSQWQRDWDAEHAYTSGKNIKNITSISFNVVTQWNGVQRDGISNIGTGYYRVLAVALE